MVSSLREGFGDGNTALAAGDPGGGTLFGSLSVGFLVLAIVIYYVSFLKICNIQYVVLLVWEPSSS